MISLLIRDAARLAAHPQAMRPLILTREPPDEAPALLVEVKEWRPARLPNSRFDLKKLGRIVSDIVSRDPGSRKYIASPQTLSAVMLHIRSAVGEELAWETMLAEKGGHVALDYRKPVVRILPGGTAPRPAFSEMKEVRVAATLAHGTDTRELAFALVRHLRKAPCPVQVRLFVDWPLDWHAPFLASVRAATALTGPALGSLTIRCEPVPQFSPELLGELSAFDPHVLHFHCHGDAVTHGGRLLVGREDTFNRRGVVGFDVTANDLKGVPGHSTLVLMLSSCESADPTKNTYSLARTVADSLQQQVQTPAVVAMRGKVDQRFVESFVGSVYATFATEVLASGQPGMQPWWERLIVGSRLRFQQGNADLLRTSTPASRAGRPRARAQDGRKRDVDSFWPRVVFYLPADFDGPGPR